MGLFDWVKGKQQAAVAPTHPRVPPRVDVVGDGCRITFAGASIQLPARWVHQPASDASASEEFRNERGTEQLLIRELRMAKPVSLDELEAAIRRIAESTMRSTQSMDASARFEPPIVQRGQGQAECRVFGASPSKPVDIAWLGRGDAGRIVTFSFYKYDPLPAMPPSVYAGVLFDLVQFEPTR